MNLVEFQNSVWYKCSWWQTPDLKQLRSIFRQSSEKIETSITIVVTKVTHFPDKSSLWSQVKYDKS